MFGIHSKTLSSAALALALVLFLAGCSDTDKIASEKKIEEQKQALEQQKEKLETTTAADLKEAEKKYDSTKEKMESEKARLDQKIDEKEAALKAREEQVEKAIEVRKEQAEQMIEQGKEELNRQLQYIQEETVRGKDAAKAVIQEGIEKVEKTVGATNSTAEPIDSAVQPDSSSSN
ncbi:MAG: hypothetical protein FWG04_05640 [Desulfovibrionaceae bacterium]|nr:hypothetical protein [Desulfovibrionaceae bacterium]